MRLILSKGKSNDVVEYDACYLYPFDSRASSDMITQDVDGFIFRGDFETQNDVTLRNEIERGDKFNSSAEYSVEYIQ